jgi:hypothetical protein
MTACGKIEMKFRENLESKLDSGNAWYGSVQNLPHFHHASKN